MKMNGAEVLKIMPLASLEADAITRVASYIPVVQQYAYKFLNGGTAPFLRGHTAHTLYCTQDTLKANNVEVQYESSDVCVCVCLASV